MKLYLKPITKRVLSILLAIILVLGFPSTVMADTVAGGSETTVAELLDATEPVSTQASDPSQPENSGDTTVPTDPPAEDAEETGLIITPDPIVAENPYDPDWPYPYGLPVDNDFPEDLLEADPYGVALMADMSLIPDEMYDNAILRALEYTGYDVQKMKDNGWLYVAQYTSANINNYAPEVLSEIGYDDYAPFLNGDETVANAGTVTGRAPDIASFTSSGLVCASFVTYYLCNYLPNIEGIDTTWIYDAVKATTMSGGDYSTASVWSWEMGLTNLANTAGSGVTRYTDADTAYANLVPGDLIVFSNSSGDLTHIAVYAGTYTMYNANGTNRGPYHYIIHVGNSRGPEISAVEYMVSSGSKSSAPSAWYHIDLPEVQSTGFIEVYKKDPNGKNLSGAYFTAVDQGTNDKFIIGPTDTNGYAKSGEMPLGTYVVTETKFPDGYQASGQTSWTVALTKDTPDMTVTIHAVNKLMTGRIKIVKAATNGGSLAGWHFEGKDSSGTVVGTYVTDATGVIVVDLVPGTYTVQEVPIDDPYWICDTEVKTITVKAGETAAVSFRNRYVGCAKIIKTLEDPDSGTVEGWTFEIKAADGSLVGTYKTGADGTIVCSLVPGTYTVTEILEDDSNWVCVSGISQTITVKGGQTAEVTFENAIRSAEIIVYKVDTLGAPLAEAEFLLEWSEDGTNWQPVISVSPGNPVKGSCTSDGLADGKLVSGRDGVVRFSGLQPELQYRLTETKAPEGYQLLSGPAYEGSIPSDDTLTVELTVVNAPIFELPMTGSTGSMAMRLLQISGAAVLLLALLYFRKKRR